MKTEKWNLILLVLVGCLLIASCKKADTVSCTDKVGGTADPVKFSTNFNDMQLVESVSGLPGTEDSDKGLTFNASDQLVIWMDCKVGTPVTFCIQQRNASGKVMYNQSHNVQAGTSEINIGSFNANDYVIRVIVDNTLIKNFPFWTK
ncbi:MAG: hypothetical protein WC699_07685 [Bacteroidales bacterium]|jgi:hypothetical protein